MTTREYADGLRMLADWYDAHPAAVPPYCHQRIQYIMADKDETATFLRAAGGHWDKRTSYDLLYFSQSLGPFQLEVIVNQSAVCRKKVVGYQEVPAQPGYTREIVEWDCESVLGDGV